MKTFSIKPDVLMVDTCQELAEALHLGEDDLIITNHYIYNPCLAQLQLPCSFLFKEEYGAGEPSDEMAEAMYRDIQGNPKRIIAIGGGSIIDLAKFLSLKQVVPVLDLFDGKIVPEKGRELVIVPATCGTGSEVTNVAVLSLVSRNTKKGLAVDAFYADQAVLVPELLKTLPYGAFATSSIDALVHAVESALSPKANDMTKLFSYKAIEQILKGYMQIRNYGRESRLLLSKEFLMASHYAGIAFGNAGCAAVHALSYPLGGKYHVAHGESNYAMFTGVLNCYLSVRTDGEIAVLNQFIAQILGCSEDTVYTELEKLLSSILPKKALHEYGVTPEDLEEFTDSVMTNQGRLMANNFVPLDRDMVYAIYKTLF